MDAVRTFHFTLFLVLLCCRYGVSYRIYILPEPDTFCLGVFSGDDCMTWSEYSAHPKFADHSTTLIFTPGVYGYSYSYRKLTVANIKRFTMTGNGAQLQFQLTFSNVGEVRIKNLTFANAPRIDVRNVHSFIMENCSLSQTSSSSYYYTSTSPGVYFYNSNRNHIIESTFNKVIINVQSYSALLADRCTFMNSSRATIITGRDIYSSVTLNNSMFLNNYADRNGVVYMRGVLIISNCLFDRNSVLSSSSAVVYSTGDVNVIQSSFVRNRASYVSSSSRYRPVNYAYYEGGSAIRGERNINISNCTFSHYKSSSIIYSYRYNSYYGSQRGYRVYIVDSTFYSSGTGRSIYSYNDVTLVNSSFYNASSTGGGSIVYSKRTVTTVDCKFVNSTTVNGNGGVIYSQLSQNLFNSVFIGSRSSATGYSLYRGGALYSQQGDISLTNCSISNSSANGDGGAVYTTHNVIITNTTIIDSASKSGNGGAIYCLNVKVTNSTLSNNAANRNGGAIYAVENITIANSTFSNNTASTSNGGAMYSGNDISVTNCTVSDSSAAEKGGAIYSGAGESNYTISPNVVLSNSTFSSNTATSGGVLYTTGHYYHHAKFMDSTFINNVAVSGGVAHVENSSLSIINSVCNNNEASEDGGVLDMIFSSVSIRDSSLSGNNAGNNGGVFYGQNYSTNFTIAHTVMDHNSAGNGGVFYVHRSNSNIKILDAKLIRNSANNHGGVMDIRGVTLTMDMDTVIANNTAGSSGDVISACVSQITAYGLQARIDPVYSLYCSIYDEGSTFRPHPMSQTISTDDGTAVSTTEQNLIGTEGDTESVTMTVSEGGATNEEMAPTTSFASTSQSTSAAIFTSDNPGILRTHIPFEGTTSSPLDTTSQMPSSNPTTTYVEKTSEPNTHQPPTKVTGTKTQSYTDEIMTISESVDANITTSASVNQTTSSGSISHNGHEGSTAMPTEFDITTSATTTASETDSPLTSHFSGSTVTTDSSIPDPDRFAELQAEQDKYDTWKSSQHNLLQVSIISLVVLCLVCTTVCVVMLILFFMACKRRKSLRLVARAHYKKLSPMDKDLEETKHENEMEEYSFSEI